MHCEPVIWRRLGKEHGEADGFRVNSGDVVERGLREKIEKIRAGESDRTWVRVSDGLIVERSGAGGEVLYYLLDEQLLIIQNSESVGGWPWYVHVGTTTYESDLDCWVFTDHFVDVLVRDDNSTHTVVDLDDLVLAGKIGLLDDDAVHSVLVRTQSLVDLIREGAFPSALFAQVDPGS